MWLIWLIIGIVFAIIEITYSGFFMLWFSIGAFVTLFFSFFISSIFIQCLFFFILSTLLLVVLNKKVTAMFTKDKTFPTAIDSLIGKKGIVTASIGHDNFETGLVKLDGEIWTAISATDSSIEKGTTVNVVAIKGVRLVVSAE